MKIDATTVLAIYGSLLATGVLFWDILKYRHDKPRLKVKVSHDVLIGPQGVELKLGIKMANVGKGMIAVEASGFKLVPQQDGRNTATLYDLNLPKELQEGQSHTSFANPSQIPKDQVVFGWVRDATGRTWQSKKWPLRSKK